MSCLSPLLLPPGSHINCCKKWPSLVERPQSPRISLRLLPIVWNRREAFLVRATTFLGALGSLGAAPIRSVSGSTVASARRIARPAPASRFDARTPFADTVAHSLNSNGTLGCPGPSFWDACGGPLSANTLRSASHRGCVETLRPLIGWWWARAPSLRRASLR